MLTFRGWLGALIALALTMPVIAADRSFADAVRREHERPLAARFERAAFLVQPSVSSVTLAPDGSQYAYLRGPDDAHALWMAPADGGKPRQLLAHTDATAVFWSGDGRWLLVQSPRHLFAVAAAGQGGSRMLVELGGSTRRELMEVDTRSPLAVIVRERRFDTDGQIDGWRLSRVGIDGRLELLADDTDRITGFALADDGRLAFLQRVHDGVIQTLRIDDGGKRELVLRCEAMHRCALWPVLDGGHRPLFSGDIGGSLRRLQRMEADGSMRDLAGDPHGEADIDHITADPDTGLPVLVTYRGTVVESHGIDVATQERILAVQAHYPGKALSFQPGRTHWLIGERGGAQQGVRYYLYDPADDSCRDVLDVAPLGEREGRPASWLPEGAMASQLPFEWTASDGMRLHGFVRLPPGADPATVPLVAMIHGGPWGHVAANEFGTGMAQFLVNRGYAVFEPNFRGSTGYGRDYMLAARGDFGNGRVQRDIVEGVHALLAAGVGDERRVGIVGASFGGYSTLLGLTWQPELFRVGIALVPPADFAWDLTWISRTTEANTLSVLLPYERWMAMVGLDIAGGESMQALHAQSPLANPGRMDRPLTIIAGGEDQRVALRGVLGYVARLRHLGKDVTLLVDPVAGHTDARPLAREAAMYLMADALHRHLGGPAESPPDPVLQDYLTAHLRLPGSAVDTVSFAGPRPSPASSSTR